MLPSQEEVVQLLLTSPFSAAQVIISGWVQSRLRNGSSRIKATNDVVALREALPPFFSTPVDKALLACGLPPRPIVPPAGCQAAVNAGSSLAQVLSSITTARGRNRAYVRECLLEYIAQKEARVSKSMSLAERDKEIIAKLNRIEAAQSTKARLRRLATTAASVDPNSPPAYTPANQSPAEVVLEDPIVDLIQRVRVEKGLLDEPHLLKLILHPTIEPSRIESILVLFIRRQILTQGRHATSEILTRVQFSTYQRADAPEGIHDAFTSARFLSGLGEEHETRTDARLPVSQGLAQKDALATILVERVLKKKDSREQEILLKESLREWIVLVVYAGTGEGRLWWGGGESKNESGGLRAKVGVQVDELDRLLCFNHPHVRFLRSVIAAFRKIHDFPTSLPLYEEPVTSSLPIESLGLNPSPDCPFIGTGPSDAPLSAQIFETPDLIKDHPTLQVVFSRLIALAEEDFSAKEAVLLDWVSNQWETIILTGREWGREDRVNAGADLALLEASIDALLAANPNSPGCKEFSPAFESVRRSPVLAGSPTPSQGRSGIQSAEEELWETLPDALASGSGSGSALASGSGSFTAFDAPGPSSGPYTSSPPLSRLHPSNEAVAAVADAFSPSATSSSSSSFSSAPSRPPSVPLKPGPLRSTPSPRSSSFSSQSSSTLNRRESRPLPTPHPFAAHDGGSFISSASSSSASSLSAPTLSTSVTSTSSPSFDARRSSAPAFSSSPLMRGSTLLTEEHTVPESPDDNDPFADPSTPLSLDSPSPPHLLLPRAAAYHQGFSPTATFAGNDAAQATIARWSASQPLLRAVAALEALDPQSTPHAAAVIQDVLLDFIEDDAAAQAEAAAEQAAAALASSGGAGGSGVEKGGAGSPAREAELRVVWSVAKLEEVVLRSFGGGDWGGAAAEREGGTSTAAIAKVFARLRGTRPTPLPAGAGPVGVPTGRAISFSAGSGVGGSSSNGVRRAGSGGSHDPSTPHRPGLHSMTVSAPSVVMGSEGRTSAGGGGGAVLPSQMAAIGTSSATTPMPHLSPPPTEEALPPYSLE